MTKEEIFVGDKFISCIFWLVVSGYYMAGYGINAFGILCLYNAMFGLHIHVLNINRSMNVKWNEIKHRFISCLIDFFSIKIVDDNILRMSL